MKKVLLANGDSWTFGSEIMAPEFCVPPGTGTGMAARYKPGLHDFHDYNDYYRVPRIWSSYLATELGIPDVVNISQPARSNDTIYDTTVAWLLENYISKNKSTDELLVVIGWSGPERKNIILNDSGDKDGSTTWLTVWPAMIDTQYYTSSVMKGYFKFYVMHLWAEQEFIKRYVEQNYHLQNFCKLHNIDYYVFNAFYAQPNVGPSGWSDISIVDTIDSWTNMSDGWNDKTYNWSSIMACMKQQWAAIDVDRFVNKDLPHGSFRSYIFNNVDEDYRMCNWHPSPESHEAWAVFLAQYIQQRSK